MIKKYVEENKDRMLNVGRSCCLRQVLTKLR